MSSIQIQQSPYHTNKHYYYNGIINNKAIYIAPFHKPKTLPVLDDDQPNAKISSSFPDPQGQQAGYMGVKQGLIAGREEALRRNECTW